MRAAQARRNVACPMSVANTRPIENRGVITIAAMAHSVVIGESNPDPRRTLSPLSAECATTPQPATVRTVHPHGLFSAHARRDAAALMDPFKRKLIPAELTNDQTRSHGPRSPLIKLMLGSGEPTCHPVIATWDEVSALCPPTFYPTFLRYKAPPSTGRFFT